MWIFCLILSCPIYSSQLSGRKLWSKNLKSVFIYKGFLLFCSNYLYQKLYLTNKTQFAIIHVSININVLHIYILLLQYKYSTVCYVLLFFKKIVIYKKSGKWYSGWIEEVPGVNTQGKTLIETKKNLKEALSLILETNRLISERSKGKSLLIREQLSVFA